MSVDRVNLAESGIEVGDVVTVKERGKFFLNPRTGEPQEFEYRGDGQLKPIFKSDDSPSSRSRTGTKSKRGG